MEDIALAVLSLRDSAPSSRRRKPSRSQQDMDLMTLTRLDSIREQIAGRSRERFDQVFGPAFRRNSAGRKRNMV